MCGIFSIFKSSKSSEKLKKISKQSGKMLSHRGPDYSGTVDGKGFVFQHERLAIMDPTSGNQPFETEDYILTVNGEIYNWWDLKDDSYNYKTNSDCEVILSCYKKYGIETFQKLDGVFAFVLYDKKKKEFIVARDAIGVIPLYMGYGSDGSIVISSELKAMKAAHRIQNFPPGHYYSSKLICRYKRWYNPNWCFSDTKDNINSINIFKQTLYEAVKKRLMTHVPWGVLLSGGLDSSTIAAIAKFHLAESETLKTFSIGLENSPDLINAKKVANHLKSRHYEFTYTIQEGLDALEDVIYHLETYDTTTVRASVPMYLMARKIKTLGVKMVLSGEGADEILGGYLYFHKAPNPEEFFKETVEKVEKLHLYDCLRANKSCAAWGVETRVPFLDKKVVDSGILMDVEMKIPLNNDYTIEKWPLRIIAKDLLPEEITWRQKEQFSDGVGYSWIDSLKKHANTSISTDAFNKRKLLFPYNTPKTKENFLYRMIFEKHFRIDGARETVEETKGTIACSTERALEWDKTFKKYTDASGRCVGIHKNTINK